MGLGNETNQSRAAAGSPVTLEGATATSPARYPSDKLKFPQNGNQAVVHIGKSGVMAVTGVGTDLGFIASLGQQLDKNKRTNVDADNGRMTCSGTFAVECPEGLAVVNKLAENAYAVFSPIKEISDAIGRRLVAPDSFAIKQSKNGFVATGTMAMPKEG